jgi:hypothetical protein
MGRCQLSIWLSLAAVVVVHLLLQTPVVAAVVVL